MSGRASAAKTDEFPEALLTEIAMQQKILVFARNVSDFEQEEFQSKAKALIPLKELHKKTSESPDRLKGRDELVKQLLAWYRSDFFTLFDNPQCSGCSV